MRMLRWSQSGVLGRVFSESQRKQPLRVRIECLSLDSTIIKVHPDGTGTLKKTARDSLGAVEVDGAPRFIGLPQRLATSSLGA